MGDLLIHAENVHVFTLSSFYGSGNPLASKLSFVIATYRQDHHCKVNAGLLDEKGPVFRTQYEELNYQSRIVGCVLLALESRLVRDNEMGHT